MDDKELEEMLRRVSPRSPALDSIDAELARLGLSEDAAFDADVESLVSATMSEGNGSSTKVPKPTNTNDDELERLIAQSESLMSSVSSGFVRRQPRGNNVPSVPNSPVVPSGIVPDAIPTAGPSPGAIAVPDPVTQYSTPPPAASRETALPKAPPATDVSTPKRNDDQSEAKPMNYVSARGGLTSDESEWMSVLDKSPSKSVSPPTSPKAEPSSKVMLAKLMRTLLAQAQICQQVAKALHNAGADADAVTYVRRQRAFEADIGTLRGLIGTGGILESPLVAGQTSTAVKVPQVNAIAALTNAAVEDGVLQVTMAAPVPSPYFVRLTCESQALDASTPAQVDLKGGAKASAWRGFPTDGMRAVKFAEHRRIRVDLRKQVRTPEPAKKPGFLSTLKSMLGADSESDDETDGPPPVMNLDAVDDGSVLVAAGHVRLSSLLGCNTLNADVALTASRDAPKTAIPLPKVSLLIQTKRPLQSRAAIASLPDEELTWTVLPHGQSGPVLGVHPPKEADPNALFLPLDTDDGVITSSYVVLEAEIETEPDVDRKAFLQGRLDVLASAVDEEKLSMDEYTARVRQALSNAKRTAVERKRAGDLSAATAWLRRIRLMETELREVGAL